MPDPEFDSTDRRATGSRVTHGRHCSCTPCRAQDWSEPGLAPCGMHPDGCPPDGNVTPEHKESGGKLDDE